MVRYTKAPVKRLLSIERFGNEVCNAITRRPVSGASASAIVNAPSFVNKEPGRRVHNELTAEGFERQWNEARM